MKAERAGTDHGEHSDNRPGVPGRDQASLPDDNEGPQQTYEELAQAVREDRAKEPRRVFGRSSEGMGGDDDESRPADKWSDPETTSKRIEELKIEGHGPQRHLEISNDGLRDRLGTAAHDPDGAVRYRGNGHVRKEPGTQIDPETGTRQDAATSADHFCGPYATRFDNAADYCRAEEILRERAKEEGQLYQVAAASEIFPMGDPNDRFTGYYQDPVAPENADGSARFKQVDFTGTMIKAYYEESDDGILNLITLYADPDNARHVTSED